MRVRSGFLKPLAVRLRSSFGSELCSLRGALSLFSTPHPGRLLAQRSLLALVCQPRLMLDFSEKTTTTCH